MKKKIIHSINKSLDWIVEHLDCFIIPEYNVKKQEGTTKEKKALCELACTLIIIQKTPSFINDTRINKIKKHVHKLALTKNFEFNMQNDMSLFPFYLMVYVSLREIGIEIDSHRKILKNLLNHNYIGHTEKTPWQLCDLKYFLDKGGFENQIPKYETLYASSSLKFLPNPLFNRTIDSYAITHLLFFLSDFGSNDITGLLGEKASETKSYIEALTKMYTHNRDWDLLGELLISCHILKHRDFALHQKCLNYFLDSQCDDGDFISRNVLDAFDNNEALSKEKRFKANYHPTLVGLFCCILEYEHIKSFQHENRTIGA
jgi:hypothetical protein